MFENCTYCIYFSFVRTESIRHSPTDTPFNGFRRLSLWSPDTLRCRSSSHITMAKQTQFRCQCKSNFKGDYTSLQRRPHVRYELTSHCASKVKPEVQRREPDDCPVDMAITCPISPRGVAPINTSPGL